MADSTRPGTPAQSGPAWASWLGITAVVLGLLLAAAQATELVKQAVMVHAAPAAPAAAGAAAACPADELAEEGLSMGECLQLVSNVQNFTVSAPEWFPSWQMALSAAGTMLALLSVIAGVALLDFRAWGPRAAAASFAALTALDAGGFVAVLNTGPILRDLYLWPLLSWFVIHLMMTAAAVAAPRMHECRDDTGRSAGRTPA